MMTRKNSLPKFPDSYIGDAAVEYDSLKWMERNQKETTLKCLEYLFDEKLGEIGLKQEKKALILDLGCGTGYSSEILIENGYRVIGVDILDDMILQAKKKKTKLDYIDLDLILADISYLPFRNNVFNHGLSISAYNFVTYGIHDQSKKKNRLNNTAKDLNKILKTNGRLIIEFYPQSDTELGLFSSSFTKNGFEGYMIKKNPAQRAGQTFLLLRKN